MLTTPLNKEHIMNNTYTIPNSLLMSSKAYRGDELVKLTPTVKLLYTYLQESYRIFTCKGGHYQPKNKDIAANIGLSLSVVKETLNTLERINLVSRGTVGEYRELVVLTVEQSVSIHGWLYTNPEREALDNIPESVKEEQAAIKKARLSKWKKKNNIVVDEPKAKVTPTKKKIKIETPKSDNYYPKKVKGGGFSILSKEEENLVINESSNVKAHIDSFLNPTKPTAVRHVEDFEDSLEDILLDSGFSL